MRIAVIVLAMLVSATHARADAELWTAVGVDHERRRVELSFEQHLRFDATSLDRIVAVMPEAGVRIRILRGLRFGLGYRYQYQRDGDDMFVTRHRFDASLRGRAGLGDWRVDLEARLQHHVRPDKRDVDRDVVRGRAGVSYRGLRRWTPAAAITAFHVIDSGAALDKLRYTVACSHRRHRREVELYYTLETPLNDREPMLHVLGVGYYVGL